MSSSLSFLTSFAAPSGVSDGEVAALWQQFGGELDALRDGLEHMRADATLHDDQARAAEVVELARGARAVVDALRERALGLASSASSRAAVAPNGTAAAAARIAAREARAACSTIEAAGRALDDLHRQPMPAVLGRQLTGPELLGAAFGTGSPPTPPPAPTPDPNAPMTARSLLERAFKTRR